MATFEKQKVSCLSQVDLSKKGSIDDQIIDLVQYINAKENYFTTSSCSGRISVFSELADQRKKHCEWLYITHCTAGTEEVISSFRDCQGRAVFKFEPFVLHVQCKDLESGQLMLKTALISGFKNSGIVIGKKANVIVAVRSAQSLEVPLVHNGELMVSDQYIKFLVDVANKKMEENQIRIDRFFTNLHDLSKPDGSPTQHKTCTGARQTRKDTWKDKLPIHITNGTSHPSNTEQCTVDDIMDCLASFYGDVS